MQYNILIQGKDFSDCPIAQALVKIPLLGDPEVTANIYCKSPSQYGYEKSQYRFGSFPRKIQFGPYTPPP